MRFQKNQIRSRLIEESLRRDPWTHSEIARAFGVSRERVRQIAGTIGETGKARQEWLLAPEREARQAAREAERFRCSFASAMRRHLHEAGFWRCVSCGKWLCEQELGKGVKHRRCLSCTSANTRKVQMRRHLRGLCYMCPTPLNGRSAWLCSSCCDKLNAANRRRYWVRKAARVNPDTNEPNLP